LDRIILAVKSFAQNDFEGKKFMQALIERAEKINELSRQNKIFTLK
jgi:hypothetical protein